MLSSGLGQQSNTGVLTNITVSYSMTVSSPPSVLNRKNFNQYYM